MIVQKRLAKLLLVSLMLCCYVSCNSDDSNTDDYSEDDDEEFFDDDADDGSGDTGSGDDGTGDTGSGDDGTDGGEGEITSYTVSGSTITKLKDYEVTGTSLEFQNDVAKHEEIWELSKKIIPESHLGKIGEFLIFSGENTQTAGFVLPISDDLSTWRYAIAIDFAYEGGLNADGELVHTIIHEFGHVITLNNEQINPSISETDCTNFFPNEGCANSDAYINQLQTQFWADIYDEFLQLDSEEATAAFYTKYEDRFVSDYAATNPGEDIAEVFATFVIGTDANGTTVADQKIQLMYTETELTDLRDFIRANDVVAKGVSILPSNISKRKNFCGTSRKLANNKL